jgi:uncharacterized protein YegJ (DUF2314 family)
MPEVHIFREDDAEINAAIAEAQTHYEKFVVAMIADSFLPKEKRFIDGSLVKARFQSPTTGSIEHIWVHDLRLEHTTVVGLLASAPKEIPELHEGDEVRLRKEEISDWFYWDKEEKTYGGFVVRVLAARGFPW